MVSLVGETGAHLAEGGRGESGHGLSIAWTHVHDLSMTVVIDIT